MTIFDALDRISNRLYPKASKSSKEPHTSPIINGTPVIGIWSLNEIESGKKIAMSNAPPALESSSISMTGHKRRSNIERMLIPNRISLGRLSTKKYFENLIETRANTIPRTKVIDKITFLLVL